MNKLIPSLSDNTFQTQQKIPPVKTRPIIISSLVTEKINRRYINMAPKEAAVPDSSTSCSNSKALLTKPEVIKTPAQSPESEAKILSIMRRYINIAPKDATSSHNVTNRSNSEALSKKSEAVKRRFHKVETKAKMSEAAKHRSQNPEFKEKMSEASKCRWQNPDYRKKMSEASKCRWQNPKFRKKVLNAKECRYKNPIFLELSKQRADEAIDSILAQTEKIKEESQENVFPKGDHELQMIGCSRVIHEINNSLPILQDSKDPTHSLLSESEGSIDQIKISRYGGLKLSSSQKKQILQEVKEWIRLNESDRGVYQQKFEELFEISIPIEIGPDRGRSVYAKRNIRKFEVVGPYAGILQRSEEDFRRSIRQKGSYNVLSYLFGTRSKHRVVDGFGVSNTTSLINTGQLADNPVWNDNNLAIIQVGKNLNFFVAKRDIPQGEELLVDYGRDYNPMCFFKRETQDQQK